MINIKKKGGKKKQKLKKKKEKLDTFQSVLMFQHPVAWKHESGEEIISLLVQEKILFYSQSDFQNQKEVSDKN